MSSLFKEGTTMRNARADAFADTHDTGTPPAVNKWRTGSQPTNVSDASSGTLLGTTTHSSTAYGSASSGAVTAAAITSDTSADASGTVAHVRTYAGAAGDTAALWQANAGDSGDSADVTFDNKVIVAGGVIAVTSMVFTEAITQT